MNARDGHKFVSIRRASIELTTRALGDLTIYRREAYRGCSAVNVISSICQRPTGWETATLMSAPLVG